MKNKLFPNYNDIFPLLYDNNKNIIEFVNENLNIIT